MRQDIVTIEIPHFEWRQEKNEQGQYIGEPYKFILSNKIFTKQVLITYDDNDMEITRENYIPPSPIQITDEQFLQLLTPERIQTLKQLLNQTP